MSSTFHAGWACRVSAATPATCGEDIDVPESAAPALPVPMAVEMMLTPGAVTSGLRPLSPPRGPAEVKLANPLKLGFEIDAAAAAMLAPSAASSAAPSVDLIPRNGIVTLKGLPSSGLEVMGPSNGGNADEVFTITTAAAPACWPKMAFATRAQVPRVTTAIVFAPSEFGPPKSSTLHPSDSFLGVAGLSAITLIADNPATPRNESLGCRDRKSTRLNSSHITISYAVFCLKKKKKKK